LSKANVISSFFSFKFITMAYYNTSLNNQCMRLVQNTSNNRQNIINNYLRNVSCKKRWHFRGMFIVICLL
jgi:hypothetical protein